MIIFAEETKSATDTKQVQLSQSHITEFHIKSLAASCAACHGTNGNSSSNTPSISNIYKPTFVAQMLAFRSGERPATVMHRHAKGLTIQEIEGLAEYFSRQPRLPVRTISPQNLSETYPN